MNVDHVFPDFSYLPQDPLTRERAADLIWREVQHDSERVIANLSPGCGRSAAQPTTSVMVNGVERSFLVTVPQNYVSHDASPLIVAFHGRTNSNEQVRSYFGLDKRADEFFIVYPAGVSNGKGAFSWADPGDTLSKTRDIAFFDEIIKTMAMLTASIWIASSSQGTPWALGWPIQSPVCAVGLCEDPLRLAVLRYLWIAQDPVLR